MKLTINITEDELLEEEDFERLVGIIDLFVTVMDEEKYQKMVVGALASENTFMNKIFEVAEQAFKNLSESHPNYAEAKKIYDEAIEERDKEFKSRLTKVHTAVLALRTKVLMLQNAITLNSERNDD